MPHLSFITKRQWCSIWLRFKECKYRSIRARCSFMLGPILPGDPLFRQSIRASCHTCFGSSIRPLKSSLSPLMWAAIDAYTSTKRENHWKPFQCLRGRTRLPKTPANFSPYFVIPVWMLDASMQQLHYPCCFESTRSNIIEQQQRVCPRKFSTSRHRKKEDRSKLVLHLSTETICMEAHHTSSRACMGVVTLRDGPTDLHLGLGPEDLGKSLSLVLGPTLERSLPFRSSRRRSGWRIVWKPCPSRRAMVC